MAGYEVTYDDFVQLIDHLPYRPSTAALLRKWYGYEISGPQHGGVVRAPNGEIVDIRELHREIQADPDRQYVLYQTAQSLWR